ncbi:MAG TPA: AGE family epimerase/isomerase [Treponemataceae bacterium]|nr:AGE family epimerase/isomerase [Treponemataceae bacterium]
MNEHAMPELSGEIRSRLLGEVRKELTGNILPFWMQYARDEKTGGFYGTLTQPPSGYGSFRPPAGDPAEPRSVVMTARHLWAYSAAFNALGDAQYLDMARYAWNAIVRDYADDESGGVFWSVNPDGSPAVARKQIYGEAFAVYGLAEYALALKNFGGGTASAHSEATVSSAELPAAGEPLALALSIYDLLEGRARDRNAGGYFEARSRDWSATTELKLSDKDIDCDKSMNTNLHVMEAYTTLLRVLKAFAGESAASVASTSSVDQTARLGAHPSRIEDAPRDSAALDEAISRVRESLAQLVRITTEKILGPDAHLDLYFNADWKAIGDVVSYGHDIECSWLLWEAVEELDDPEIAASYREAVVLIARTALEEGFDAGSGALENETHGSRRDRTRIWWCQAEALVGFFNAWQLTGEKIFLDAALAQWRWILAVQKDPVGGDWFWAVGPDGKPDPDQPKGGNWKTSYHNARCCMEILRRLGGETGSIK